MKDSACRLNTAEHTESFDDLEFWKVEKSWKMEGSEKPTEKGGFYVGSFLKIQVKVSKDTQVKVSSYPGQGLILPRSRSLPLQN